MFSSGGTSLYYFKHLLPECNTYSQWLYGDSSQVIVSQKIVSPTAVSFSMNWNNSFCQQKAKNTIFKHEENVEDNTTFLNDGVNSFCVLL